VNLDDAVIDYERPKTAVPRVVPLWPETIKALGKVLNGHRPTARKREYEDRVFLTAKGNAWKKETLRVDGGESSVPVGRQQAISAEFNKLLVKLEMKRPGLGFYGLRHTFRTWADELNDQHAIHRIMGHAIPGMSGVYVEEISVRRLRAVVNHVRKKVFSRR
jgi:integrase